MTPYNTLVIIRSRDTHFNVLMLLSRVSQNAPTFKLKAHHVHVAVSIPQEIPAIKMQQSDEGIMLIQTSWKK